MILHDQSEITFGGGCSNAGNNMGFNSHDHSEITSGGGCSNAGELKHVERIYMTILKSPLVMEVVSRVNSSLPNSGL